MLKRFVVALGVAGLVAGAACLALRLYIPAIYLFVEGVVLIVAVAFEPWRYLPQVKRGKGHWQATGERFKDPTTGKLIEVFYNADTGQRDYRSTDSSA